MKFTCQSCGKRFASVDEPFPGRVYKIRCSRCGQLVTVQAPVPWESPSTGEQRLEVPLPAPPVAAVPPPLPPPRPAPPLLRRADETEEIPIDLALSDEYPLLRRRRRRQLWLAAGLGGAALVLLGVAAALARAPSVAGGAPAEPPPPRIVVEPRQEISSVQLPAPSLVVAAPAPASAPPPAPGAQAPAPAAQAPAPAPAPRPPRPRRVAVEVDAAPAPAAVPPAPPPEKVDPGLAAALLRKQDAPVRAGLPDPAELLAVLEGRRAALDACFDYASSTAGGAAWKGRATSLVVRVSGTGRATAAVDDPVLEPTEIAGCLRRTIARTAFPPFAGEAVVLRTSVAIPGE